MQRFPAARESSPRPFSAVAMLPLRIIPANAAPENARFGKVSLFPLCRLSSGSERCRHRIRPWALPLLTGDPRARRSGFCTRFAVAMTAGGGICQGAVRGWEFAAHLMHFSSRFERLFAKASNISHHYPSRKKQVVR